MFPSRWLPIIALLTSALVWGLVWYPFRVLQEMGLSVASATFASYLLTLVLGVAILYRRCKDRFQINRWLLLLTLTAGWTNFGYALGVTQGEVLRVMLLFFTAPLWTVIFSRLLLKEKLDWIGGLVVLLSFVGAAVMLWEPTVGWPRLDSAAEWYGLSAGMMFALSNVVIKKDERNPIEVKCIAVWVGVCLVSGVWLLLRPEQLSLRTQTIDLTMAALLITLALSILAANLVVQYGLMRTPANRAVVIMVFELVVAAASAWLLEGEAINSSEWIGGLMIIGASVFSGRLGRDKT